MGSRMPKGKIGYIGHLCQGRKRVARIHRAIERIALHPQPHLAPFSWHCLDRVLEKVRESRGCRFPGGARILTAIQHPLMGALIVFV